jgi:hypothetical protein
MTSFTLNGIILQKVEHKYKGSLQDLDKAKQILIILSKEYVKSSNHMQELHVALCRQRDAKTERIVRIIMDRNLPEKPMFVHLLPSETNLSESQLYIYISPYYM